MTYNNNESQGVEFSLDDWDNELSSTPLVEDQFSSSISDEISRQISQSISDSLCQSLEADIDAEIEREYQNSILGQFSVNDDDDDDDSPALVNNAAGIDDGHGQQEANTYQSFSTDMLNVAALVAALTSVGLFIVNRRQ
jgi:hypothetical protein